MRVHVDAQTVFLGIELVEMKTQRSGVRADVLIVPAAVSSFSVVGGPAPGKWLQFIVSAYPVRCSFVVGRGLRHSTIPVRSEYPQADRMSDRNPKPQS